MNCAKNMAAWTELGTPSAAWRAKARESGWRERNNLAVLGKLETKHEKIFIEMLSKGFWPVQHTAKSWKNFPHGAREVAMLFLAREVNRELSELAPQVSVTATIEGEPIFRPGMRICDPLEAMYLALFQELTGAQSVRTCPHPKCGARFFVTRKDRFTCGKKTCQNWYGQQKKQNGGKR